MKLIVVILLTASFCISGKLHAQRHVTLTIKNGSLETVLKEISKQTGYLYAFQDQWKEKAKTIDISVKNVTLEKALSICFKEQPFTYTIIKNTIVVKEKESPSQGDPSNPPPFLSDIHGRVADDNNQPLAGVTVAIKGSKTATSTDNNGLFNIKPDRKNIILVFTSVSAETLELKFTGEGDISVHLSPKAKQLGEVSVEVNTGYQKLPKERSTGSFTQISNQLYNQQISTDVLSRLDPITNGLTVNKKLNPNGQIMIRGLSTINGPKDPLIVVDNFPYDGDITNLNPNDIESVTILKDAAAASIWGAKAGNGVIVLTTKKGKLNRPFSVNVNSSITVVNKPDLFYLKNIPTNDFIDVEKFLFSNQYRFDDTLNALYPPFSPVYEILFQQQNGQISNSEANARIDALKNTDVRNDFLKYMYRKALNQQYSINLSGGSNIMAWYVSGGLDKNIDNLYAGYNRVTLKIENIYHPIKNLELTTGLNYLASRTSSGRIGYGALNVSDAAGGALTPYTRFADPNGNPLPLAVKYRQSFIDTFYSGKLLNWNYYPLKDYQYTKVNDNTQDIIANLGLVYKITESFNIDLKYQYLKEKIEGRTLYDVQSFYARDLINLYTQIDPNTGQGTNVIPVGSILDINNNTLESHNARGQLNFSKHWSKHGINAIAGGEIRQVHSTGNSFRTYGYNDDILTSSNVDFANNYPTLIGYGDFIPNNTGFSDTRNRFVSAYANGAYTYDDKYTLSLSARRDGSNLFGATTNNKWKPLWSSGLSWNISKENFYHIGFIHYLRLRATYGFSGNVDPTRSGVTAIGYLSNSPYTNTPRSIITNFYNPTLRWENVRQINLALDFSMFHNRISGSIDYYQKKATDLLAAVPLDYTTGLGAGTTIKNVASMKGNGLDIAINTININGKFKWTSTLNLSTTKDKVIQYYSSTNASLVVSGGIAGILDRPVFGIYSYKWAGLDPTTGDPMGYLNKNISKDYTALTSNTYNINDLVYKGSFLPTTFGSLGNTLSWKNFSLSASISYKFGYYFRKPSINYNALFANAAGHLDYIYRWQKPGDEKKTNVPSLVYPNPSGRDQFYNASEVLVAKGDNIRLQYINLSYDLNKDRLKSLPFKNIQLYVYINNLGIIWRANKDGIDPDYQAGTIPPSKSFSAGLHIQL